MARYDPNPIIHTDEYGNPVDQTGTTGAYGTGDYGSTTGTGVPVVGTGYSGEHQYQQHKEQHGLSGMLHRSGSSSSSSSEDDGQGGRRKKRGTKEKIKEKLPGVGHRDDQTHATATTTVPASGHYAPGQHHEKKGMMEKIKEKLPGHH